MKYFLDANRGAFDNKYRAGLSTDIFVPLNIRSASGRPNNDSNFTTSPDPESVSLIDWIQNAIDTSRVNIDSLHHGNFADDAAAATGSVPVGGVYFNTTNSKLHTRMS